MTIMSIGRTTAVLLAGAVMLAGCKDNTSATSAVTGSAPAAVPLASASADPSPAPADPSPAPADNGVAALGPAAILKAAKAALTAAKSFHLQGKTNSGGETTGLDFKIDGTDVAGKMTMGGADVELLSVGGQHYMRPSSKFWTKYGGGAKQGAAIAQLVGDRWVTVPASDKAFGSLFTVTDVSELLKPDGKVTKGAVKEIDGTKAIGLAEGGSDGGTLWVATVGKPYPLRLQGPTAADGGLTFSDFGATFADIKKPSATQVVDLSKLAG